MDSESRHISLPDEIILHILSFCSPLDIVRRMRLVSKRFRNISYDSALWNFHYTNTCLPRPPGPYPCQSSQFLERTLVHSARLARSWITEPFQTIVRGAIDIPAGPFQVRPLTILCRRWIVNCEADMKIVLYDIGDARHTRSSRRRICFCLPRALSNVCKLFWNTPSNPESPQVIWQREREWTAMVPFFGCQRKIHHWHACSVTSMEGEFLYVLIEESLDYYQANARYKLLEFRVDGDSGRPVFCESLAIPLTRSTLRLTVQSDSNSTFAYISDDYGLAMLLDTKTRIFYEFPTFKTELTEEVRFYRRPVFLTRTHVLVFYERYPDSSASSSLMQAFTLPADPRPLPDRLCVLSLTHECLADDNMSSMSLIRDTIVDPQTGSTNIRLLHPSTPGDREYLQISCVDLVLPKSIDCAISPMYTKRHVAFTVNTPFLPSSNISMFVEASSDGHVRGFCCTYHRESEWPLRTHHIVKFEVDATSDECVSIVGQLVEMKGRMNHLSNCLVQPRGVWFDGVRGRLCYEDYERRSASAPRGPYVADIKV